MGQLLQRLERGHEAGLAAAHVVLLALRLECGRVLAQPFEQT